MVPAVSARETAVSGNRRGKLPTAQGRRLPSRRVNKLLTRRFRPPESAPELVRPVGEHVFVIRRRVQVLVGFVSGRPRGARRWRGGGIHQSPTCAHHRERLRLMARGSPVSSAFPSVLKRFAIAWRAVRHTIRATSGNGSHFLKKTPPPTRWKSAFGPLPTSSAPTAA